MNDVDIAKFVAREHGITWYQHKTDNDGYIAIMETWNHHFDRLDRWYQSKDTDLVEPQDATYLNVVMTKKRQFIFKINNTGVIL